MPPSHAEQWTAAPLAPGYQERGRGGRRAGRPPDSCGHGRNCARTCIAVWSSVRIRSTRPSNVAVRSCSMKATSLFLTSFCLTSVGTSSTVTSTEAIGPMAPGMDNPSGGCAASVRCVVSVRVGLLSSVAWRRPPPSSPTCCGRGPEKLAREGNAGAGCVKGGPVDAGSGGPEPESLLLHNFNALTFNGKDMPVTTALMCECSRRRSPTGRFEAFRWRSLFEDPSPFRIGSGARGSTCFRWGWTAAAPRVS